MFTTTTLSTLHFRAMVNDDLEQVNRIEQRSSDHPWRPAHFADSLASGYCCTVVEMNQQIVGYGITMEVIGESSLLIITVDKDFQRQGIGRQLLHYLIQQADRSGCETLLLEVRRSNRKAFNLYLHEGFCEIGIRKNYYPTHSGSEDAIVMAMEPANMHSLET